MDKKTPRHPGHYLRANVVDALGLTIGQTATALSVTRQALSTLLNGRASLTPEMAIRIEKAFGLSMEKLLQMQMAYDIALARSREAEIHVARYVRREAPPAQPQML